ncbi:MAG: hypothetical protein WBL25_08250 [Anaerolineales bacterium]
MIIQDTGFVCNLTVLSKGERELLASVTDSLFASVQETRELENGFAFRFNNQPDQLVQIANFIERESRCCSFLHFNLDVEPSSGPLWLRISGEAGTKTFLRAELAQLKKPERS